MHSLDNFPGIFARRGIFRFCADLPSSVKLYSSRKRCVDGAAKRRRIRVHASCSPRVGAVARGVSHRRFPRRSAARARSDPPVYSRTTEVGSGAPSLFIHAGRREATYFSGPLTFWKALADRTVISGGSNCLRPRSLARCRLGHARRKGGHCNAQSIAVIGLRILRGYMRISAGPR